MRRQFSILIAIIFVFLSACAPTEPENTPVPTETNTPRPNATLKPSETPPTPTVSIPSKSTTTQEPTHNITYSIDEAEEIILSLIHDKDCQLPCIWNLLPNKDNENELEDFFNKLEQGSTDDFSLIKLRFETVEQIFARFEYDHIDIIAHFAYSTNKKIVT